jgi:tryptophan-rich sensory protein
MSRQILGLAGWLAVAFAAAAVGAVASAQARTFYAQLMRPEWAPAGWVFGPVWTLLYAMMAVAAWMVWRERGFAGAGTALGLFLAQLVLNALWSWLFFAWRLGGWAFAEILVLWVAIAATTAAFWMVRPPAGALLLPYLAWVSFAAVLNWSIWQMNPGLLR